MQAGSVMAVWELVQPKLWRVVCVVWEGGRGRRPKIRWMQAGMGVLEGSIARSIDSRHVGILLLAGKGRVAAGIKPSETRRRS